MKITNVVYDGLKTTVTCSTPLGEITQSVTCSEEDYNNNKFNKDAGGVIATRKCEIEYRRRKLQAFRQRYMGAKMLVDMLLAQAEAIEYNSSDSYAYLGDRIEGRWDAVFDAEDALKNFKKLIAECKEDYELYRDTFGLFIDYAQHKFPNVEERTEDIFDNPNILIYNLGDLKDDEDLDKFAEMLETLMDVLFN